MKIEMIISLILIVVGVISIFFILAGLSTSITDASNKASTPTNCSDTAGGYYNASNDVCVMSSGQYASGAKHYILPMQSLFSANGILIIILMLALFMATAIFLFRAWKQK